jgi:hypothetical protein
LTRRPLAQRLAEHLIGHAVRDLPDDTRDEYYRECVGELFAILHDPDVPSGLRRSNRALFYAAGHIRSTRRLPRTATKPQVSALPGQATRRSPVRPVPASSHAAVVRWRPAAAVIGALVIVAAAVYGLAQVRDNLVLELYPGSSAPGPHAPQEKSSSMYLLTPPGGVFTPTTGEAKASATPTTTPATTPTPTSKAP